MNEWVNDGRRWSLVSSRPCYQPWETRLRLPFYPRTLCPTAKALVRSPLRVLRVGESEAVCRARLAVKCSRSASAPFLQRDAEPRVAQPAAVDEYRASCRSFTIQPPARHSGCPSFQRMSETRATANLPRCVSLARRRFATGDLPDGTRARGSGTTVSSSGGRCSRRSFWRLPCTSR